MSAKWPSPSQVRIVTDSRSPQVLRLRIASFPGWKATIDGKMLPLATYLSMMLPARIPPGNHVIELRYWPTRFSEGLVIAAVTVLALLVASLVVWWRRRAALSDPTSSLTSPGVDRPPHLSTHLLKTRLGNLHVIGARGDARSVSSRGPVRA